MRECRKQQPKDTSEGSRGIIVQTIKSFINLPMFVPLSIPPDQGWDTVTDTIGSGTATLPDIQIFSPNIKTLLSPSWARKLTHLNRASDRTSLTTRSHSWLANNLTPIPTIRSYCSAGEVLAFFLGNKDKHGDSLLFWAWIGESLISYSYTQSKERTASLSSS